MTICIDCNKDIYGHAKPDRCRPCTDMAKKGISKPPKEQKRLRVARLGIGHTEEARLKVSTSLMGNTRRLGTTQSFETRRKISFANIGDKHPNWQGGLSPYAPGFTEALKFDIRIRDGFICGVCDESENGIAHDVHHIDYDKFNHSWGNLITLCKSCHMKTNFGREKWIQFFTARN